MIIMTQDQEYINPFYIIKLGSPTSLSGTNWSFEIDLTTARSDASFFDMGIVSKTLQSLLQ